VRFRPWRVDVDVDIAVDLDGDGNVEVAGNGGRRSAIWLTCCAFNVSTSINVPTRAPLESGNVEVALAVKMRWREA